VRSVYRGREYDDGFMIVFVRVGMLTSAGVICCNLSCGLRFAGDFVLVATSPTVRSLQKIVPTESPSYWLYF
jgi:hypothetical protein